MVNIIFNDTRAWVKKECLHSFSNKCRLNLFDFNICLYTRNCLHMLVVTLETVVPFWNFPEACHSLWLTSWYFELSPFILSTAKLFSFCFPCLEGYFVSVNTLQHICHCVTCPFLLLNQSTWPFNIARPRDWTLSCQSFIGVFNQV